MDKKLKKEIEKRLGDEGLFDLSADEAVHATEIVLICLVRHLEKTEPNARISIVTLMDARNELPAYEY